MPNQGQAQKHKLALQTPKIPSKILDAKDTPMKGTHLSFVNLEDETTRTLTSPPAEDFIKSLWPLLEAKLDNWIATSLTTKVESIAVAAVDKYVSSEEFKNALTDSLNFDLNQIQTGQENILKDIKEIKSTEDKINGKLDDIEQYSRRNNIRLAGIAEVAGENTDDLVINTLKDKLGITITSEDICRSHRVGPKKFGGRNKRQIIVKLVRHNKKSEIMRMKKQLKNQGNDGNRVALYEDLSKGRLDAISKLNSNEKDLIHKLWTVDGVIYIRTKSEPEEVLALRYLDNLENFIWKIRTS